MPTPILKPKYLNIIPLLLISEKLEFDRSFLMHFIFIDFPDTWTVLTQKLNNKNNVDRWSIIWTFLS